MNDFIFIVLHKLHSDLQQACEKTRPQEVFLLITWPQPQPSNMCGCFSHRAPMNKNPVCELMKKVAFMIGREVFFVKRAIGVLTSLRVKHEVIRSLPSVNYA